MKHHGDVLMSAMASQITDVPIVYSIVFSGEDQRKHQSSASLAFVRGIHRWPLNSSHQGPITRKMFPFDDIIMEIKFGTFTCIASSYWPWWSPTTVFETVPESKNVNLTIHKYWFPSLNFSIVASLKFIRQAKMKSKKSSGSHELKFYCEKYYCSSA